MKYAIVTGGTSGIGKQICKDLLLMNYYVITNFSKNYENAEIARAEFSEISFNFDILKIDQSDNNDLLKFIKFIKSKTNKINCIVCNTGTTLKKDFEFVTNEEWDFVFRVNVHSHFYIIRDLTNLIQKSSRIVFVGSLLGEVPHSTSLVYGVTKAAIHAMSKNLVKEFSKYETTVNVIAPGFIETDWQSNKPIGIRNSIYQKTAIPRFGTVLEVSDIFKLILKNEFINGSTISIDGGYNFK